MYNENIQIVSEIRADVFMDKTNDDHENTWNDIALTLKTPNTTIVVCFVFCWIL